MPEWQSIEIVREGEVDPYWASLISTESRSEDIGDLDEMEWLQLRELDLKVDEIRAQDGYIEIPFVVGLRFEESSFLFTARQGTMNVQGALYLLVEQGEVKRVEVVRYFDSQSLERIGRSLGTLDQYDGGFVDSIVRPVLRGYFTQKEPLTNLMGLLISRLQMSEGRD